MTAVLPIVTAVLAAAMTTHPRVVHEGTLELRGDAVAITVRLDEHQLDHERLLFPPQTPPADIAAELAASFEISSLDGQPFYPFRIEASGDPAAGDFEATAVFRGGGTSGLVFVSHRPAGPLAAMRRQLRLAVSADSRRGGVVLLTSEGNVEPLGDAEGLATDGRLAAPRLIIDDDAVHLDFPLATLRGDAAFRPVGRLVGEVVNADEAARIEAFFRDQREAFVRDAATGESLPIDRVRVLDPNDDDATTWPAARSRHALRVRLSHLEVSALSELEIVRFPPGVFAIEAIDRRAGAALTSAARLNPSEPVWLIKERDGGERTSGRTAEGKKP